MLTPEIRILLIDRDRKNVKLIQKFLTQAKDFQATLVCVDCLEAGLNVLKGENFEIVLCSLLLPDEEGLDVVRNIHHLFPQIPIVVLSRQIDESRALAALREGAQDYLVKGQFNLHLLVRALRHSIERQRLHLDLERQTLALQTSQEQLQTLIAKNADGILVVDRSGAIQFVNPAAEAIFGRTAAELQGQSFGITIPSTISDRVEISIFRPSGEQIAAEMRLVEFEWLGKPAYLASLREITARKQAELALEQLNDELQQANEQLRAEIDRRSGVESELRYNVGHDALTGLLNRISLMQALGRSIDRSENNPNYLFAILFLDLDRFKLVNDSLGHLTGDQLLVAVARRLENCLRQSDIVARFGGDEFIILLDDLKSFKKVTQIAERIVSELKQPFQVNGHEVFTSTSIGIALSTGSRAEPDEFIRDADIALYQAKAKGKCRYEIFNSLMYAQVAGQLQLETDLRRGLEQGEFVVHYQPIISLFTNRMVGFEALVRWNHPERGLVPPDRFIPIAEETGLLVPLDWWVLNQACGQMRRWQSQFPASQKMVMSVNLSGKQFWQPDCLEQIEGVLHKTGLPRSNLKLEVTEGTLIDNDMPTSRLLSQIRALGMGLSIDDFGTGYSSLSYLHRFPFNTLKIDRSFISMQFSGESKIVEAIIVLAHNLGMNVIAEGVETSKHKQRLRELGCEQAQGYLFSPPVDAVSATELFDSQFAAAL
ncbi:EAL domain-containing protein [Oscillatoriales cyanobacterium LEGE 11467]|uniref:EAL domain-containing protein n=1 Tax=Zarconia navalis LEGE 11467 TaxID=1828826 RepID=A0A928W152_9CYAN|nr:EAL domain-containing protein [Zarconia navalis]MBE9041968.1 EAL domain-containing protein [Zarconia navalis LEGE 11467]